MRPIPIPGAMPGGGFGVLVEVRGQSSGVPLLPASSGLLAPSRAVNQDTRPLERDVYAAPVSGNSDFAERVAQRCGCGEGLTKTQSQAEQ